MRRADATDAEAIARIHVEAWRETYSGLLPDPVVTFQTVGARTALWRDVLADGEDADNAVFLAAGRGFVACCAQRDAALRDAGYAGEISALYTRRAAQGRGLGRYLFLAAMTHLAARGLRGAALWVLASNAPARAFYERIGGRLAGAREDVIHHHAMDDVAYGWPDIDRVLQTGLPPARSDRKLEGDTDHARGRERL